MNTKRIWEIPEVLSTVLVYTHIVHVEQKHDSDENGTGRPA